MKRIVLIGAVLACFGFGLGIAGAADGTKTVTVELQEKKANGKAWDAFGGKPDVALCVTTPKGKKCYPDGNTEMGILEPKCQNSFTCEFTGVYIEEPYELIIVDVDMAANDVAGNGKCEGGDCTLGLAKVKVK